MAEITDPAAVNFANAKIRPAADRLAQLYYCAKAVTQEWYASGMGDVIVYNNPDLIVDGSAIDGRHPMSGVDANNIINRLSEFVTDMEANTNAKLNTVLGVAVNPLSQ